MSIAVIGAGITGVTTTYFLTRKGFKVNLIEQRRYPAMATSYANGGQLSASNSEAWNSWKNVKSGLGSFFLKNSSVIINPTPSIDKLNWLLKFLVSISKNEEITYKICKMAIESINLYKKISVNEKIQFDLYDKGILHFYHNKQQTSHAIKINKIYNKAGLKRIRITNEELFKLEPSLKGKQFDSVFYTKADKSGDIHKFCNALISKLVSEKKVKILSYKVEDLKKEMSKFDKIILCAGVASKYLAKTINDNLDIYPVKGYSITLNNPGITAPSVSLLDDERKIVSSRLGKNKLRVAGIAELNGYNLDILQDRIRPLINWCIDMFPNINTKDIKPWAGLRPMTPNMLPIIKKSDNYNVWYNTGHGHLGWTLSAYTANYLVSKFIK